MAWAMRASSRLGEVSTALFENFVPASASSAMSAAEVIVAVLPFSSVPMSAENVLPSLSRAASTGFPSIATWMLSKSIGAPPGIFVSATSTLSTVPPIAVASMVKPIRSPTAALSLSTLFTSSMSTLEAGRSMTTTRAVLCGLSLNVGDSIVAVFSTVDPTRDPSSIRASYSMETFDPALTLPSFKANDWASLLAKSGSIRLPSTVATNVA